MSSMQYNFRHFFGCCVGCAVLLLVILPEESMSSDRHVHAPGAG